MKNITLSLLGLITTVLCYGQTWTTKASLPNNSGRHHPVTWGLDGNGYVITGTNSSGQPTKDFFKYDPVSDTWQTMNAFPGNERSFSIGAVYNGKGYMGFGASLIQFLNDLWEYDPVADQWTQLPSCPCTGRRHPAFVIKDGRLFVGLGDGAPGNLKDWWEYDIENQTWTQHPDLPGPPRHHPYMFKAGDDVYAGMGHGNSINGQIQVYDDWYKFDMTTNQWVQMNDFPGEGRVAGSQFDHGGFGYVLSGDGEDHNYMEEGEFWKYDPVTDAWEELPPHPDISRWAPGAFVIDNNVYFTGGQSRLNGQYFSDLLSFPLAPPASVEPLASLSQNQSISLFPNPAQDRVFIKANGFPLTVEVYSLMGKKVMETNLSKDALSVGEIPNGIYLIKITNSNKEVVVEKLTIQ